MLMAEQLSLLSTSVARRRPPLQRVRATAYDAGAVTRRTIGWNAPTVSPNRGLLGSLHLLRDRSRAAVRNDGYAKGAIDKLVSNIIGTGIKPLSQAVDADFRKSAHDLWLTWTDQSDADGLLDWYGQQAQAVRGWLTGGEIFARLRPRRAEDGLAVPLQVQLLEPELCPHTHTTLGRNGNRIRAGIEFNGIGQRVAYWFHPSRPGSVEEWDQGQLVRVPAESVIHFYNPLRPGQIRGEPHLTQALIKLMELDKFDDATLLRQQLSNLFVGFVKKQAQDDATINPLTGLEADDTHEDRPVLKMEPGIFQELDEGEEVDFSDPPSVGETYPDFMRQQLFGVATATGVPYEVLTGDMKGVNDRVVRVILGEFRRMVMTLQHQIVAHQLCRPVWNAWMDRAFFSSALDLPIEYVENPTPWSAVKWMPQGWAYLHPVQDVQAKTAAIAAGLSTRSAEVSEQGEDAEAIDLEQAADNARADELGLKYSSDGRHAKASAAPPDGDPEPDDPAGDPDNDPAGQQTGAPA